MKKATVLTLLFSTCFLASMAQSPLDCGNEKGVKSAIITSITVDSATNEQDTSIVYFFYNKEGKVSSRWFKHDGGTEYKNIYEKGKLMMTLTIGKEQPGPESDKLSNEIEVRDTLRYVKHTPDGRPAKSVSLKGRICLFEYKGCQEQLQTFLSPEGDTTYQTLAILENEQPAKVITTYLSEPKAIYKSYHFDYQYNKRGHWIERKSKWSGNTATTWRELTYY